MVGHPAAGWPRREPGCPGGIGKSNAGPTVLNAPACLPPGIGAGRGASDFQGVWTLPPEAVKFTIMPNSTVRVFFDFIDPLSYLLHRELEALYAEANPTPSLPVVAWHPFELRPPPSPLITVDDEEVRERWALARMLAPGLGVDLSPNRLVPWSSKAHELLMHAGDRHTPVLRQRLFDAYLTEGMDIGRVDVLVELARGLGLDTTEAKAVLDVDRHRADVVALREEATAEGVSTVPTILFGGRILQGFHNRSALGTLLRTPPADPHEPKRTE